MSRVMTGDDELIEISGWTDDDAGVLYAASVLEELSLIELVERLNELNQNKMLSIGAGEASNLLHEFWDQGYKRMPAARRAAVFAQAFGTDGEGFAGLLETLATALADGANAAPAAAALREHLLAHADDATAKAAGELRGVLGAIGTVLSDMELRSAYRAGDMWQVVEHVQQEFGGAAGVQGVRTRTVCGALLLHRLPELSAGDGADEQLVAAAGRWLPASHPAA
jgi:hypothetical protein